MSFFGDVELLPDDGVRFTPSVVTRDLQRSRREIAALMLGAALGVLLWTTFSTFAPMVQGLPQGFLGAAFWPLGLLYLGAMGALIVAVVNGIGGPRAATSIALLLATLLPFMFSLMRADIGAHRAIPSSTWANVPFVARPLANSFDLWRRTPHDYKPAVDLVFGLIGCSVWSIVVLPVIVLFVRKAPVGVLRIAPVVTRTLVALSAVVVVLGALRAFLRPSVPDLPFVGAEVATAPGVAPATGCPRCTEEIVACCTPDMRRGDDSHPRQMSRYSESLGPFTLFRTCEGGGDCGLELFHAPTNTRSYAGQAGSGTPVTLRHAVDQRLYWLIANGVPIGSAPEPELAQVCKNATPGTARPTQCGVDAGASARSLRGLVGPPRPAVLVAALGLALALASVVGGHRSTGAKALLRPGSGQRAQTLEIEAAADGDAPPIDAEAIRASLLLDPARLLSLLKGRALLGAVSVVVVLVVTNLSLIAATAEGFLP